MFGVFLCAIIAIALTTVTADQAATNKFLTWFESNGGVSNGLTIHEFHGMGNGFKALRKLEEGSIILQIPKELQFSVEQMKNSDDDVVKKLSTSVTDGDMAIAAWILLEKYRGESSFYAPYIALLPSHVTSVLYFSDEDLEALQEPDFIEQIKQFQATTKNEFRQLKLILNSDKSGKLKLLADHVTEEDYFWACTIVNSRGLRFRGQIYLSPMADIFNYKPHPSPREAKNGDHFLKHHILDRSNGTLTILSDRTCDVNEQCFEDYGDNNNQIYLQYHGFVPSENPFHCLRVSSQNALVTLRKDHEFNDLKTKIITKLGLNRPFSECINERGSVSRSMGGLLAIASLNAGDVEACLETLNTATPDYKQALQVCRAEQTIAYLQKHALLGGAMSSDGNDLDGDNALFYSQVLKNLERILHAEMTRAYRFDTTLEEDQELLVAHQSSAAATAAADSWTVYSQLAVHYRMSNKRLCQRLTKVLRIGNYEPAGKAASSITASQALNQAKDAVALEVDTAGEIKTSTSSQQTYDLVTALEHFNNWFNAAKPKVNKLKAVAMPRYRIGTITTDTVQAEETYLSVPVSIIMDSEKAFLFSGVSSLLQALSMKYKARDDFHELLFFLIYETFVMGTKSTFGPYLAVLPRVEDLTVPLMWEQEQIIRLLNPSLIAPTAVNYRSRTLKKFDFLSNLAEVKDFFDGLKDVNGNAVFTLERYLWATAILDSRAIWWSGRRHLVPMLDFINCEEHKSDPKRVHATVLDGTEQYAITKSGTSYEAGDQLFENYGQPNHIYYLYHGFTLEENTHDCVSFEIAFNNKEWQALKSHGMTEYLEVRYLGYTRGSLNSDVI